jgi:hypothetical protein
MAMRGDCADAAQAERAVASATIAILNSPVGM